MLRHAIYFCAFLFGFTAVQAEQSDQYFGVSFVSFEEDSSSDGVIGFANLKGDGFALLYGVRFNQTIKMEAAYAQYEYDDYHENFEIVTTGVRGRVTISGDAESLDLAVLVERRLSNVSPFLMLGYVDYDTGDATALWTLEDGSFLSVNGGSEADFYFGFGAEVPVPNNPICLRLSHKIGNGDVDVDFTSLGVTYNF